MFQVLGNKTLQFFTYNSVVLDNEILISFYIIMLQITRSISDIDRYESATNGENNVIRKPDPDFIFYGLLTFHHYLDPFPSYLRF